MSVMTESSLMLASSSVFWRRWIWLLRSRTNCLRIRRTLRISSSLFLRYEAAADEPVRHQVGQPSSVVHVGLAARHVLHMRSVGQHQLELAVRQDVPHRLPVDASRLHHDMRASLRRQPRRQGHQVRRRRLKRPNLSAHIAVDGVAGAGHDAILVDIQSGTIGVQNFHVPSTTAAGLEPLLKKSNKRAPGPSPDHGTIWGAQGFPVRLIDGFAHTKETPTSLPTAHQPTRSPPVSYPAGRELRWRANKA